MIIDPLAAEPRADPVKKGFCYLDDVHMTPPAAFRIDTAGHNRRGHPTRGFRLSLTLLGAP